jgi:undecaprenyl-diphosphatase
MSTEARLWLLAITFVAAFAVLGIVVATYSLSRIDLRATTFRGQLTNAAIIFTRSGRAMPLLGFACISVLIYAFLGRPILVPLGVIGSQVASQTIVEIVKRFFRRARPAAWLHRQELGLSYPSGHATTAVVFFGAWFLIAFHVPLPALLKILLCAWLLVWMIGIDWSRMALGAHYFSDILGGTLFGCAWMCALFALLLHYHIPLAG